MRRSSVRVAAFLGMAALSLLGVPACEDDADDDAGSGGRGAPSGGNSPEGGTPDSGGASDAPGGSGGEGDAPGGSGGVSDAPGGSGGVSDAPGGSGGEENGGSSAGGKQSSTGGGGAGGDDTPASTGGMPPLPLGDPDCAGPGVCRHGASCLEADWTVCACPNDAVPECGTVHFRALGFREGTNSTAAADLTEDGSMVVGLAGVEGSGQIAMSWTVEDGIQPLAGLDDPSVATAISASGTVIAGYENPLGPDVAFRLENGVKDNLGFPLQDWSSSANDLSADGSTIVGARTEGLRSRAFRWTESEGVVDLGEIEPDDYGYSFSTNADGTVIVGIIGTPPRYAPFRWDADGGLQLIELPDGLYAVSDIAVSADGSTIVLDAYGDDTFAQLRWTDGVFEELETIPGNEGHQVFAVNADGSVVVGRSGFATLWRAGQGVTLIEEILTDAGVDLSAWSLDAAHDVSDDGKVVAGTGYCRGRTQAWIAWLPE